MKLAILGATGATGQCLLRQAMEAGHQVVAVVRDPDKLRDIDQNVDDFNLKVSVIIISPVTLVYQGRIQAIIALGENYKIASLSELVSSKIQINFHPDFPTSKLYFMY